MLLRFRGVPGIRQMIDETDTPPSLIFGYLDDDLLNVSQSRRIDRSELKFVAKKVLTALQAMHEAGYVHTGK